MSLKQRSSGHNPKVSVIIPSYNSAAYIGQTIESVLAQDYTDYEIIVVDDGSTDETQAVLARYRSHIRAVYQPNAGASEARNHGLRLARGEYIVFLDSDDLLLPHKLQAQVLLLDEQPALGYIHSGWQRIDETGTLLGTVEPWQDVPELTLENWLMYKPVFMGAMLIRRRWIEQVGGFDPALPQSEDFKLLLQMVLKGCQGAWLYEPTACYRQHQASLTKNRVQMLACANQVVAEFFAQPNLPPAIAAMKNEVGFGTLVWSAWQLHLAGNNTDIADFLRQSMMYDHSNSPAKVVQRWLHALFFQAHHNGYDLSEIHAFWPHIRAVIQADEQFWQQLEPALNRWLKCFTVLEASY